MKILKKLYYILIYVFKKMQKKLNLHAFTQNTLSYTGLPSKFCDSIMKHLFGGTYLSQVEFHLADHCNLNCIYCDHFSPVAEENIISLDTIITDMTELKGIFGKIGTISFTGGEPLLNPNITDLFAPIRQLYPDSKIQIITNGILLGQQDENFWNLLKKYDITLGMTKYPIKVDYDFYYNKCKKMNIKVIFFNFSRDEMHSIDLNYKCTNNKKKAFSICANKTCHLLRDKKLYHCTLMPCTKVLNKKFNLNFQIQNDDFVDLTKVKSATEINRFFRKPIHFCGYCRDKARGYSSWRNSSKQVTEWVREDTL